MVQVFSKSWLKILSGLFTNLAAAALALVVITPNLISLDSSQALWLLTYDGVLAIVFLVTAVKLDELL